jgi:hypothetical protein
MALFLLGTDSACNSFETTMKRTSQTHEGDSMKKLQLFLRFLGIALILSSVSMPLVAGVITFHPESGLMAGNGCPDGSSRMYVDEYGDLVMEHDAMALTLPSYGQDSSLAGRQSCTIRVPITLKRGFYVTSIEQRLTFSATKSTKADGMV